MPDNKNMKQQGANSAEGSLGASRKPASKAAGTRAGTLLDWRGNVKSGKAPRERFNALRDGR
ncbi:MAG: hypothetical protein V7638_1404 [Acidobacteriota bacterium]|jgi:hypothetical protein